MNIVGYGGGTNSTALLIGMYPAEPILLSGILHSMFPQTAMSYGG